MCSNDYNEDMISVEAAKRALEDGNAELLLIGGGFLQQLLLAKKSSRRNMVLITMTLVTYLCFLMMKWPVGTALYLNG